MKKQIAVIVLVIAVVLSQISLAFGVNADVTPEVITSAQTITNGLVNRNAYVIESGSVLKDKTGGNGNFYTVTNQQDYILDFSVKMDSAIANNMPLQLRLRSNWVNGSPQGHSTGYRANIYKDRMTLEKFNDNNPQSTVISTYPADFTKETAVRIVANGTDLWIAIGGTQAIVVDDAPSFANSPTNIYGGGTNGNMHLTIGGCYKYNETVALDGITIPPPPDPDLLKGNDELFALIKAGNGYKQDGDVLNSTGSGNSVFFAENIIDFIFNFNIKFTSEANIPIRLRIRCENFSNHATGYLLEISKNSLVLNKWSDSSWSVSRLQSYETDFTKSSDIRVVANDGTIWIAVNGVKRIEITDAYKEAGDLWFDNMGYPKKDTCQLKEMSLYKYNEEKANDGITIPDKSLLKDQEALYTIFSNNNMFKEDGGVLKSTGTGDSAFLYYDLKDFIYNFKVRFTSDATNGIVYRIRSKSFSNHATGYRLEITKTSLIFAKWNDDNWSATTIKSIDYDFTNFTSIRIAGNGSELWIAIDGIKYISLTDAYAEPGDLWLDKIGMPKKDSCELKDMSLYSYDADKANDGISLPVESDDILSTKLFVGKLDGEGWEADGEKLVSTDAIDHGTNLAQVKDFVLDFDMQISPSEIGELEVRIRHSYNSSCNLGYRISLTSQQMVIAKYNDNNFQNTPIKSYDVDMSKINHIRIAANGGTIVFRVNNDVIYTINNAYNGSDLLQFRHTYKKGNAIISNIRLVKYSDEAANATVTVDQSGAIVFPVGEMKSVSSILEVFKNVGWNTTDTSAISTKAGKSKGVNICETKNFVLDFTVKINPTAAGTMMVKFRHYYKSANYGYILNIASRKATLTRYKEENNGNQDTLASRKLDFSKGVKVRIVCNDKLLWIAFDGVKCFEIKDASVYKGQIQFLDLIKNPGDITLSNFRLMGYDEEISYEGMSSRALAPKQPLEYFSFDFRSQEEAQAATYGKFNYVLKDGYHAVTPGNGAKGAESHVTGNFSDFVFDFDINMDELKNTHLFQINFRKTNVSLGGGKGYSLGYQLNIAKNQINLKPFEGKAWTPGKVEHKVTAIISGWTHVRVVVLGNRLVVLVNDQMIVDYKLSYLDKGFISLQNTIGSQSDINYYMANASITEYYEGAIPAGAELVKIEAISNDRVVKKPLYDTVLSVNNSKKEADYSIYIYTAVATVLAAGVIVGVYLIAKHRKKVKGN